VSFIPEAFKLLYKLFTQKSFKAVSDPGAALSWFALGSNAGSSGEKGKYSRNK